VSQSRQVEQLVVPSSAMHDLLREYGVSCDMTVIPTGLDLNQIAEGDGQQFRQAHGITPDRPVLGHIGRVAHEKNIVFLLYVLKRVTESIPNILLIIAGEGPAKKSLMRHALRMGLSDNVLFVGYLSRQQALWDCYRAADVFVFSSRTETQGLVLLEAMASGVPVVSTAVLGTKDILLPERGAVVAVERVDDFSNKVIRLLQNRLMRANIGREGRAYVHEWSDTRMAMDMEQFYLATLHKTAVKRCGDSSVLVEQNL
jgi:glycosyltransferase involved in cell wall biosynthesis